MSTYVGLYFTKNNPWIEVSSWSITYKFGVVNDKQEFLWFM